MSWVIYEFSYMFICLLWFCHGLPKREIVRTYVFHLLRTYITHLCNWLILWENALYLYLDRSSMCLILQETCCSSLVLKSWRLDKEISEEKLFTKARQIARHLQTNSLAAARQITIYQGLIRLDKYYLMLHRISRLDALVSVDY